MAPRTPTRPASVTACRVTQCLTGFSDNGTPEVAPRVQGANPAVLSYYDGNTVTALWNYAQHFAMSDNSYGTTYGPSTPGAFNVIAARRTARPAARPRRRSTTRRAAARPA